MNKVSRRSTRSVTNLMIMVIFGAGASYDSCPTYDLQFANRNRPQINNRDGPPLANELFDSTRPIFAGWMDRFSAVKEVVPFLQNPPPNSSVEHELEKLQAEANDRGLRFSMYRKRQQLAAVRFYLRHMLIECERNWSRITHDITNYKTLVDRIETFRKDGEAVCLVTFNYDTILEEALRTRLGIIVQDVADYIAEDYKVIKVHGSTNWVHQVVAPAIKNVQKRADNDIANELITSAAPLGLKFGGLTIDTSGNMAKSSVGDQVFYPALAIPVETKSEYECPESHVRILQDCLPTVSKLLIIGWRATEHRFLEMLTEKIGRRLRLMVVTGSEEGSKEIVDRLMKSGLTLKTDGIEFNTQGFSNFIISKQCDKFLKA
jgi:hypothetical protein